MAWPVFVVSNNEAKQAINPWCKFFIEIQIWFSRLNNPGCDLVTDNPFLVPRRL
jgi:hypothetical protein